MTWDVQVTSSMAGGTRILAVSGRIDAARAQAFEAALTSALDPAAPAIFDVHGLDYISSAGLEVLRRVGARFAADGRPLVIAAPTDAVRLTLALGASDVPVASSVAEALARLG